MELSRGELLYNEAAEKYNLLLERFNVIQKEKSELEEAVDNLKREAEHWKRAFYDLQKRMEAQKPAPETKAEDREASG